MESASLSGRLGGVFPFGELFSEAQAFEMENVLKIAGEDALLTILDPFSSPQSKHDSWIIKSGKAESDEAACDVRKLASSNYF